MKIDNFPIIQFSYHNVFLSFCIKKRDIIKKDKKRNKNSGKKINWG